MSNDEIDLDRVITDPVYRRAMIDRLNAGRAAQEDETPLQPAPAGDQASSEHDSRG